MYQPQELQQQGQKQLLEELPILDFQEQKLLFVEFKTEKVTGRG